MKKFLSLISFFLIVNCGIQGQKTFAKDVAPIIYNKCTTCHRTGEIGPFSLTSYDDVANRSSIIKSVVSTGYMPPWKPDPAYSHFLGEYYLTEDEKQTIIDWVDQGAEYGDSVDEPDLPNFPEGSLLGEPDLVLTFEETHVHKGNNDDEYRYFVLPTGLTEDRVIKAIELRPGNSQIVHHALFFEDTQGRAAMFDAQTPEYGFEGFGSFGTDEVLNYDQYPGYVPGTKPIYYPDGFGQKLSAGADLVIQMHYAPWPVDAEDKSSVNIFFADEDEVVDRFVDDRIMLPFDLPGGFFSFNIPPNQVKEFHGIWNINQDLSLIGLSPHMHYLGKSWEVWLEDPIGNKTNLIKINDWDFNWQGGYYFPRLIPAKAGSKIHAVAVYDNTASNPQNPSNPPKYVWWGEGTTDEMYYLPILSIPYQDGDEDVVFSDQTSSINEIDFSSGNWMSPIYPNPVSEGNIFINFHLSKATSVRINILDMQGRLVRNLRRNEYFNVGNNKIMANVNSLTKGMYFINISGENVNLVTKFIKE
ncbi:MAG: T9SS type A sorting domain-containing protein [Saprospiraceae bacterium]|nr:T9SS type A sorting domain-containing protein [Saprospiraceae bacterium]